MDSDELAEKVKAKLMPSIERMMSEIINQEVANLVSETVRSELRSMTEGFNKIVEENRSLKIRVDNLEMQSRSNNLVIHGLPEKIIYWGSVDFWRRWRGCAQVSVAGRGWNLTSPTMISSIVIEYPAVRVPVLSLWHSQVKESEIRCTQQKMHYVEAHKSSSTNISQRETQRYSQKEGNCLGKKIAAVWTWNGFVYLKRTESSRPVRI